jgi:ATP-dependent exoDNAse (exonuclease V) alpha subunit
MQQTFAYYGLDELRVYKSSYTFEPSLQGVIHYDQLKGVQLPGTPSHELYLAVGMPIMVLRNLHVSKGLVNGALGVICELSDNVVIIKLDATDEFFHLQRICFPLTTIGGIHKFVRHQFPVEPAFAITISKSQGKTIRHEFILDLSVQCFSHGQCYVAFSRSDKEENMIVMTQSGTSAGIHNVVYRQMSM